MLLQKLFKLIFVELLEILLVENGHLRLLYLLLTSGLLRLFGPSALRLLDRWSASLGHLAIHARHLAGLRLLLDELAVGLRLRCLGPLLRDLLRSELGLLLLLLLENQLLKQLGIHVFSAWGQRELRLLHDFLVELLLLLGGLLLAHLLLGVAGLQRLLVFLPRYTGLRAFFGGLLFLLLLA